MLQERYERKLEEALQKHWESAGTYRFNETDHSKPVYSIDTPPPFTSGELHMGHVLSYSYFDFAARYRRMRGFNVYYPQGWDTQGFPTEVKVEKKFGRLPPVQFREKCIEWTKDMIERMKSQMVSIGFSPDWRFEYRTMDPQYHRKVQFSLIKMYNDKLVYMSKYPVYWCPKCVSAIAKAELDDVAKDGVLNHIRFAGPAGEDLIIATTRPEMLHACVAVMFHPSDERYAKLKGKQVTTPLGKTVPAIADKDVDKEFGSGLVMLCTFGDKMDVVWMHRHKLPAVEAIDRYGRLTNAGELDGKKSDEAKKLMLEKLEREGKLVKKEPLKQSVKVHDRCGTMIELVSSLQWFADIRSTAKQIKDLAGKICWVPEFGISYLVDWVEGAEWDWVISRQRVFGTPLPFYFCEACLATAAAGEKDLPFYPENAKPKTCGCGAQMKPETSTCDCWVDSSISPLVIAGWPDDKEKMKRFYPASLRPQGVEIVRTWAFYTIFRSGVALTGVPPFKTILLNGNVLAPDGKKMSKSLGNIISPADLLKDYPADAIRQWAALSGAMAKDRPFSYEDIKHAKSFLSKVWNAARFVESVGVTAGAAVGMAKPAKPVKPVNPATTKLATTDRWILGKLNTLTIECTAHLEAFEYHYAMSKVQRFFWGDFCDNYIEYVKHRIYEPEDEQTKQAALHTLNAVLLQSLKLMAPFMPHITEEVYRGLFGGKESIHLAEWPKPDAAMDFSDAVAAVEVLNAIVSELRQHKSRNRLAQNAELAKVRVAFPEAGGQVAQFKKFDTELKSELCKISKIKELEVVTVAITPGGTAAQDKNADLVHVSVL